MLIAVALVEVEHARTVTVLEELNDLISMLGQNSRMLNSFTIHNRQASSKEVLTVEERDQREFAVGWTADG